MAALSSLRAGLRLLCLSAVVLLWILPALAARAALGLGLGRRSMRRALARLQQSWAQSCLLVMGARCEVRDESAGALRAARASGAVVIANHLSYLDVLALAALLPCRFVAKREIAGWGVAGWLSRSVDTLFLERGNNRELPQAIQALEATLEDRVSAAFFPEGFASRGERIERFHAGLLEVAAARNSVCLPVVLRYETLDGRGDPSRLLCWWDGTRLFAHVWRILGLRGFVLQCVVLSAAPPGRRRKQLALELHSAMQARFEPVRQSEPRQPGG